ncbi:hypothetical protein X474_09280 [Dethiosulfatarculus sandiegensis]|uniref:Uncharacterized protein n=1 Tax=Dethiosulfatarculus sandiegensis TaxID=1429043 RepID=A0A0D2GHL2_9BACT|nr:hypothetical protein X474_09280 [Dethiosulfatarculus sandiegensis]
MVCRRKSLFSFWLWRAFKGSIGFGKEIVDRKAWPNGLGVRCFILFFLGSGACEKRLNTINSFKFHFLVLVSLISKDLAKSTYL